MKPRLFNEQKGAHRDEQTQDAEVLAVGWKKISGPAGLLEKLGHHQGVDSGVTDAVRGCGVPQREVTLYWISSKLSSI